MNDDDDENGLLSQGDIIEELHEYIDKLERMMDDLHRITEFASDYPDGWRGMLEQEY